MLDVSLRRLWVFKTVVEESGFNRAARRLGISEPSVSEHVRALEEQVGPLFVRRPGRRIELTRAGEHIYHFCTEVFARAAALQRELDGIRGALSPVTVVAQRTIASHLLTPRIARYLRQHPEGTLAVHSETQEGVFQHLRQGAADLGIAWSLDGDAPFPSTLLGWQEMAFVCAVQHPLAKDESLSPKALADAPFIGPLWESEYARLIFISTRAIGIPRLRYVLQLEDSDSLLTAVREGIGYGLMPAFAVEGLVAEGRLWRMAVKAPPIRWQIRLFVTTHHALSPAAERVRRYLLRGGAWS
ncbi:MAG: LysR family transcriptional regulator [Firmicutes bacterium]|nr:LysR family transcriptional regulator [Alicyclobacillaceae bacterium]MCL6498350.1 LysR family transcriptional regulator [Bacillota bacterium]